jgi:hypothetical protein
MPPAYFRKVQGQTCRYKFNMNLATWGLGRLQIAFYGVSNRVLAENSSCRFIHVILKKRNRISIADV